MAERVVDALEVVEVDEQQGELVAFPLGLLDGLVQAVFEEEAVRQRSGCVMAGLPCHAGLQAALQG